VPAFISAGSCSISGACLAIYAACGFGAAFGAGRYAHVLDDPLVKEHHTLG
jgi:hypothetical protein